MSDEYDNQDSSFTVFWPAVILLSGLLIWSGYQVYAQNSQQASGIQTRYVNLMKDLIQTSQKDQYAAQIVKEAEASGLIQVKPTTAPAAAADTNSTATPDAPK